MLQILELGKFRLQDYENGKNYKEKIKVLAWWETHPSLLWTKKKTLLFNSRLKLFLKILGPKVLLSLDSKYTPHGEVELQEECLMLCSWLVGSIWNII